MAANSPRTRGTSDGKPLTRQTLPDTEAHEGLPQLCLHRRKLTPTVTSLLATAVVQVSRDELIGKKRRKLKRHLEQKSALFACKRQIINISSLVSCCHYYHCKSSHRRSANDHGCVTIKLYYKRTLQARFDLRAKVCQLLVLKVDGQGLTPTTIGKVLWRKKEDFRNCKWSPGPVSCLSARWFSSIPQQVICFQNITIGIQQGSLYPRRCSFLQLSPSDAT